MHFSRIFHAHFHAGFHAFFTHIFYHISVSWRRECSSNGDPRIPVRCALRLLETSDMEWRLSSLLPSACRHKHGHPRVPLGGGGRRLCSIACGAPGVLPRPAKQVAHGLVRKVRLSRLCLSGALVAAMGQPCRNAEVMQTSAGHRMQRIVSASVYPCCRWRGPHHSTSGVLFSFCGRQHPCSSAGLGRCVEVRFNRRFVGVRGRRDRLSVLNVWVIPRRACDPPGVIAHVGS